MDQVWPIHHLLLTRHALGHHKNMLLMGVLSSTLHTKKWLLQTDDSKSALSSKLLLIQWIWVTVFLFLHRSSLTLKRQIKETMWKEGSTLMTLIHECALRQHLPLQIGLQLLHLGLIWKLMYLTLIFYLGWRFLIPRATSWLLILVMKEIPQMHIVKLFQSTCFVL